MTPAELDVLQARLRAGHFDLDEVAGLMTQADQPISWLRSQIPGNSTPVTERAYVIENIALHAKLVAERAALSLNDR